MRLVDLAAYVQYLQLNSRILKLGKNFFRQMEEAS